MRYNKLDLNLLVALDALLAEQSVSKAAEKISLSQSAMSAALKRLREFFDDDLFVTVGRKTRPTQRALELAGPLRRLLTDLQTEIIFKEPFDPVRSDRSFSIAASDYVIRVYLPLLSERMSAQAPKMRLELWPLTGSNTLEKVNEGEIDLLITLDEYLSPKLPKKRLFAEEFVAIAWTDNPELSGSLSASDYLRLGHVVVRLGVYRIKPVDEILLSEAGVMRRAEVVVGAFDQLPEYVVNTTRIATLQRRLAEKYAAFMPLRIFDVPFKIANPVMSMQWLSHSTADAAHAWFRRLVEDVITEQLS